MADETDNRHDDAPTSHTTVIRERGSGTGIIIAVILLIAVIAGIYLFSQTSSNEAAKDSAITNAAESVGEAADQVGDAAQDVANSANEAADNTGNNTANQ